MANIRWIMTGIGGWPEEGRVVRLAGLLACGLMLAGLSQPLAAQATAGIATADDCAQRGPEEELRCLRAALEAREALDQPARAPERAPVRAEGDTETVMPPAPRRVATAELGAEQVEGGRPARDADADRPLIARVTQSQADHLGRLTMRLDNGQTWQQAEPSAVPLRLRGNLDPVEISRSGFGGYRARLPELGRRIAVRRID